MKQEEDKFTGATRERVQRVETGRSVQPVNGSLKKLSGS